MNNGTNIAFRKFVKDEDGFEVSDGLKEGLIGIIDGIFEGNAKKLVKPTPQYVWNNFAYLLAAIDLDLQKGNVFSLEKELDAIVGLLHACLIWTSDGPFMLYDTIGTAEKKKFPNGKVMHYRNRGIASGMIQFARQVDQMYAARHIPSAKGKLISALKTPERDKHEFYLKRSDGFFEVVNPSTGQLNFVHVFLPQCYNGQQPKYAPKEIASYVGRLSPKFERI